MRRAPVVAGCLRLVLSAHVKMKNRLDSAKGATCSPELQSRRRLLLSLLPTASIRTSIQRTGVDPSLSACLHNHIVPSPPRPAADTVNRVTGACDILPLRSEAARQGRAVALGARSTRNMGRYRAPGAKALDGASAAGAGRATRGTPTPRRARAVRGRRPGSRQAARCLSPRTGAQERSRCPPGWGGPARPPEPSQTRAPRRLAGARPLSERWATALPLHWSLTTPGP